MSGATKSPKTEERGCSITLHPRSVFSHEGLMKSHVVVGIFPVYSCGEQSLVGWVTWFPVS